MTHLVLAWYETTQPSARSTKDDGFPHPHQTDKRWQKVSNPSDQTLLSDAPYFLQPSRWSRSNLQKLAWKHSIKTRKVIFSPSAQWLVSLNAFCGIACCPFLVPQAFFVDIRKEFLLLQTRRSRPWPRPKQRQRGGLGSELSAPNRRSICIQFAEWIRFGSQGFPAVPLLMNVYHWMFSSHIPPEYFM